MSLPARRTVFTEVYSVVFESNSVSLYTIGSQQSYYERVFISDPYLPADPPILPIAGLTFRDVASPLRGCAGSGLREDNKFQDRHGFPHCFHGWPIVVAVSRDKSDPDYVHYGIKLYRLYVRDDSGSDTPDAFSAILNAG